MDGCWHLVVSVPGATCTWVVTDTKGRAPSRLRVSEQACREGQAKSGDNS